MARPAGVLWGDGVQREHRSLEHCECFKHGRGVPPSVACEHAAPAVALPHRSAFHFSTALFGLGACSCRTRTRAWLPCLAHMLCCCCIGLPLPWLGLGWRAAGPIPVGRARASLRACMLACLRAALFSGSILAYILCRTQTARRLSPVLRPPLPPQLRRISMVERQHKPLHALGLLDAASTSCTRLTIEAWGVCGEGSGRACDSARRRLGGRRRSTPTSEHGTLRGL